MFKTILVVVAALLLSSMPASSQDSDFRHAVTLYENGVYAEAYKQLSLLESDMQVEGYKALCLLNLRKDDAVTSAKTFLAEYPSSTLVPLVTYHLGSLHFDNGDYRKAVQAFSNITSSELPSSLVNRYDYKKAYSRLRLGERFQAEALFRNVISRGQSDCTAPAEYELGYMKYEDKDFENAYDHFEKAARDHRFKNVALYYMIECRFMMKDYDYVLAEGVSAYETIPEERKSHLARIISEAYLVTGNIDKAKEYYDVVSRGSSLSRSDHFFAGSLLYETGDFQGAADHFLQMGDRADSLGQVASYQLAYCNIQLKNKIAALNAFGEAASLEYDESIQEDAYYNFAKLSFDLNKDESIFNDYLTKYGTAKKGDIIYGYMAMAGLVSRDYEAAVEAYDKIDVLDDDMKDNYMKASLLRASEQISSGSWRSAIPNLKVASWYSVPGEEFNQISRYWLAESYFRDEQYDNALKTFMALYNISALDKKPEGRRLSYDIAWCHFSAGKYDNALKWFDNYLKDGSTEYRTEAMTRIGDCYFNMRNYKKAVAAFERRIAENPDPSDIYPYYKAGVAAGLLGDNTRKQAFLEKVRGAKNTAPYYSEAIYELGRCYVASGNSEDAIRTFKMLKSSPDMNYVAASLVEIGMIQRNKGNLDAALDNYKQVLLTLPGSEYEESALLAIESIYKSKGDPDGYLAFLDGIGKQGSRTEEEKEKMYFSTAESTYLSGDYNKALNTLQNYLGRYPEGAYTAGAYYYAAESCRMIGSYDKACDYYRAAIGIASGTEYEESTLLNYARLCATMQQNEISYGAWASLNDVTSNDSVRKEARLGMLRTAFAAKKYSDAIAATALVRELKELSRDEAREAEYILAKSYLGSSSRTKAFEILEHLAQSPETAEGAEAGYLIIQDIYDRGDFKSVEEKVYAFSAVCQGQDYWLARAFVTLGDSFVELGNIEQAKVTFKSVLDGYEPSDASKDDIHDMVTMRLDKLSKL